MYSETEVERWYLGLPFTDDAEAEVAEMLAFPRLSDEEVERIYLGLPLMAA